MGQLLSSLLSWLQGAPSRRCTGPCSASCLCWAASSGGTHHKQQPLGQSWGRGFYKCFHLAGRSQPRLLLKGACLLPRGWTLCPPLSEHQGQSCAAQPAGRSLVPGGAGSGLQAEAFAPKVRAWSGGGTLSGRQARLPGAAFPAGNDARG